MNYTYTWAGREWATHSTVPDLLLRRLVRSVTGRSANPRRAGKLAREVLLTATVERAELEKTLPLVLLPDDLTDRVMPPLLEHYATTTATSAEQYATKRKARA